MRLYCYSFGRAQIMMHSIKGKFRPSFAFSMFAFLPEFKSGLIQLYIKNCVTKVERGRIQVWANTF